MIVYLVHLKINVIEEKRRRDFLSLLKLILQMMVHSIFIMQCFAMESPNLVSN